MIPTDVNLFEDTDLHADKHFIQDDLRPLVRANHDVSDVLSFAYLGSIEDSHEFDREKKRYMSKIYFFTQFDKKIQITRYSCYDKEWLVSAFHEEPLIFDPNHVGVLK